MSFSGHLHRCIAKKPESHPGCVSFSVVVNNPLWRLRQMVQLHPGTGAEVSQMTGPLWQRLGRAFLWPFFPTLGHASEDTWGTWFSPSSVSEPDLLLPLGTILGGACWYSLIPRKVWRFFACMIVVVWPRVWRMFRYYPQLGISRLVCVTIEMVMIVVVKIMAKKTQWIIS